MSRQVDPPAAVPFARAVIHAAEFAREARELVGTLRVADLHRIADSLVDTAGALQCGVRGETDAEGRGFLSVSVSGQVLLRCQRCLEAVPYDLGIGTRLLVLRPGTEVSDDELDSEEFDVLEADGETALMDLLEDEILLALPISPRHPDCGTPVAVDKDVGASAFAELARLRK